jgi:23S rRNA (cytidine2498-2'-O)-methyltransferase
VSHLLLPAEGCETFLIEELARQWPDAAHRAQDGCVISDAPLTVGPVIPIVFSRQMLSDATAHDAPSINAWARCLLERGVNELPYEKPWRLHIVPHYGEGRAGENRCRLVREAFIELMKQKRRQLSRTLVSGEMPWDRDTSLLQLLLVAPDRGFISLCLAPQLHANRANISPFPKGEIPIAEDKSAPSRAFTKLVESTQRLGREIAPEETCVDLGASPGSWSYIALSRGASVIAVDRSPLRDDLMRHRGLHFVQGDAFKFVPEKTVDWLLCDVIAEPHRSIDLVSRWVSEKRCRHFVVTIKFKGDQEYALLDELKKTLPPLCAELLLTRLCANKNEACVIGSLR